MKTFFDYHLLSFLGEGNHGLYYRAVAPDRIPTEKEVALKILVYGASDAQWRGMAREIRFLNELDSPWIVRLFESGHVKGRLFYAMEYSTMGTLESPAQPLTVEQKLRAIECAAKGLDVLHRRQIVHRDIKPAKILVNPIGGKLNDLGIADETAPGSGKTIPSGTIGFMAPEVARGAHASPASDIFGLGATLHLALTGHSLYPEVPRSNLRDAVRHVASEPPRIRHELLAPALAELVAECVDEDPTKRLGSARDVAGAISAASASLSDGPPGFGPGEQRESGVPQRPTN